MQDILQEITAHKRLEIDAFKRELPETELHRQVEKLLVEPSNERCASMSQALMKSETGIIAEFKRKSPSEGWIKQEAEASIIPLEYERSGAAAISILTDEMYFGGSDEHISAARGAGVTVPILYKNFIVDEYQLFQARLCGASAVLLIAAVLSKTECRQLLHTAHELGLEVLLEMHSERETEYADLEPDMCGINNRNLGTFTTDVNNSFRLSSRLPEDVCRVSESGISNPETVRLLRAAGFSGFLIGSYFMKSDNPAQELKKFLMSIQNSL